MEIPTLTTERLILRPPTLADAPAIQNQFGVWEILQYLRPPAPWPYPDDGAAFFLEKVLFPGIAKGEKVAFLLVLQSSKQVIGSVEYRHMDQDGVFERGFWLAVPYHGQGYMSEATNAANSWMFSDGGMEKIVEYNAVTNVPSKRVKEKQGFVHIGVRPAEPAYYNGDTEEDEWELTKQMFLARHANH